MPTLDELLSQLAEVQDRLLGLPDYAFRERHPLLKRQDELRQQVAEFHALVPSGRTEEDLRAEKTALQDRIEEIRRQRIDAVVQAGGGPQGSGQMGNLGSTQLNQGIEDAQGVPQLKSRVAQIDQELARRHREETRETDVLD